MNFVPFSGNAIEAFTSRFLVRFKNIKDSAFDMKKYLCLLLILVVACTQVPDETYEELEINETELIEEPEKEPEKQPERVEPELQMSTRLSAILEESERVSQYEYTKRTGNKVVTFYVDGEKIKAEYPDMQSYKEFEYLKVFVDRDQETAFLVCDDVGDCKGTKAYEVDYSDFEFETPKDVIEKIEYAVITEETQLENKDCVVISNVNDEQERIWIWEYWGMPLKSETIKNGKTTIVEYRNLVVGPVDAGMPDGLEVL